MAKTPLPAATTTTPTTAQRKMFAKMGLAMPDGSFYIRNGPMGATDLDNAIRAVGRGEADGGNGNDIRRHIMKRATALKLQDKIPDTWNSDGSLKHDWTDEVEAYLAHFGVKGMHWGVRHSPAERAARLDNKIARAKAEVAAHDRAISNIHSHIEDANKNGVGAELFKKKYGEAHHLVATAALRGVKPAQLLAEHKQALQDELNDHQFENEFAKSRVNRLQARRAKIDTAQHSGILDDDDVLEHYGVKGMQWRSTAQRQAALATQTAQGQKGVQAAKAANAKNKADKHQLHLLHLAHLLRLHKMADAAHAAHVSHLKATGKHSEIPAAVAAHKKQSAALTALANNASNTIRGATPTPTSHSVFDDPDFLEHYSLIDWGSFDAGDSLEHFGVKGMHWGVRHSKEELETKASQHEQISRAHAEAAKSLEKDHQDLMKNGYNSAAFKRVYGNDAHMQSDQKFYLRNGQTKGQALHQTSNNLRLAHNSYVRSSNRHAAKAAKLRAKAATMSHGDFDDEEFFDSPEDVADILEHFGVKGMHWGVRRARKESSDHPVLSDAERARRTHETIQTHGLGAVSNEDLQHLVSRQNLERQYGTLNQAHVSGGRKFVTDFATQFGKNQANQLANKAVAEGLKRLAEAHASKAGKHRSG